MVQCSALRHGESIKTVNFVLTSPKLARLVENTSNMIIRNLITMSDVSKRAC